MIPVARMQRSEIRGLERSPMLARFPGVASLARARVQRVGAKRRPMTGSAKSGADFLGFGPDSTGFASLTPGYGATLLLNQ
jgi:hypothetical protein